jgi:NAD(P)-dependent dehydrogenase (short-subunit alcohol dehydrogenase family)
MSFNLKDTPSREGRTAIVTGANAGLGYETTIGLAKKGMTVIMACRNMEKAKQAKSNILDELRDADLETMQLDLASLASVRSFTESLREKYDTLDLLVNNAGVMIPPYSTTEDGFELQLGVNHLGHFLLTSLLIDRIPDTPESRIVSLSSIAHRRGEIHFDDLQWEKSYSKQGAYNQSKLACLLFADELDRRLRAEGKKKLSVCAHPGVSPTELSRHMPSLLYTFLRYTLAPFLTHPPNEGAMSTLQAALGENVKGGDYYGPQGFQEMKGKSGLAERAEVGKDQEVAQQLWDVSEKLTNCSFTV